MGKFKIEIADTPRKRELGYQFYKNIDSGSGMLFKFPSNEVLSFWMKNTYVPLDIAFIDEKNTVVKCQQMVPLSLKSVSSDTPCVFALEVPAGELEKAGCSTGSKARIDLEKMEIEFK